MILAKKSGWIIGVHYIRETKSSHIVKPWCEEKEVRVRKGSEIEKLFENAKDAENWIKGIQP